MKPKGKRVAIGVGVLSLVVVGLATWFSWLHLRFWWLFQPLGANAQGFPEYRHPKTGIVFAAHGDELPVQQFIELRGQAFPDVIGTAEHDGLGLPR